MAAYNITLENVEQINARLVRLMGTDKLADIVLITEVQEAIVQARGRVRVKTGELRDSIGIVSRGPLEIVAGSVGTDHAREQEWGNRYITGSHYWCPPIWEAFFRIMRKVMNVIKEQWAT